MDRHYMKKEAPNSGGEFSRRNPSMPSFLAVASLTSPPPAHHRADLGVLSLPQLDFWFAQG
jgi:hypothetical protein